MQFNLFILGTTLLFILSQFGYVTDACCLETWTKINQFCYIIVQGDRPFTVTERVAKCISLNAVPLDTYSADLIPWLTDSLADYKGDNIQRLVCKQPFDAK